MLKAAPYVLIALLYALALAAAARGEGLASEQPSQYIWKTQDGTYTNLPLSYGKVEQWKPSRDRWTPVSREAPRAHLARPRGSAYRADLKPDFQSAGCRDVYLGSPARGGGTTICGGERAVVREQRVRQKGSIVTSTDTVLTIDGQEVMRTRGRRAEHDPGATEVE